MQGAAPWRTHKRAQDRFRRVTVSVPNQVVSRGGGETMRSEVSTLAHGVSLDRAWPQHIVKIGN